jgi:hypothetical protein
LTVTVGNANVGVAEMVGVNVIVGVSVNSGVKVASGVNVKAGVSVAVGGRGVGVAPMAGALQASIARTNARILNCCFLI